MNLKGRGRKPQPATPSLFEWALTLEQERNVEPEPVSAGALDRHTRGAHCVRSRYPPPHTHVCGPLLRSGPATRPCVRVLLVAWEGRASAPAVDSAARADQLLLPFLPQGEPPIEKGYGCRLRPFVPGLALRVDRPRFNQDRFDFGPSAFLCDGERGKAVVPKCCGLACVVYVDARFNLCLHLSKLSVAYR